MRNLDNRSNIIVREALRVLGQRMPPDWRVQAGPGKGKAGGVLVRLRAPDGRATSLAVEVQQRPNPRSIVALAIGLGEPPKRSPVLVMARYLSSATRERLREADLGFVDLTGNIRVSVRKPGLFIEAAGATEDPEREERPSRSLRGPKAGRVVRDLVDFRKPPGVRQLAERAGVDAGYASRVLRLLAAEALIDQGPRGRIERVDWTRLLRRWAEEAPLDSRGRTTSYLEPRGISGLIARLLKTDWQYAVTGSLAASRLAPVAAPRLATVYTKEAEALAKDLGLRSADSGANVMLVEPVDDGVFARAELTEGVRYAAPSQVATDLLTSPGRGPAEAEELIAWMSAHEEAWRG